MPISMEAFQIELALTERGYGREYLEYLPVAELNELYQREFNNN